MPQFLVTGFTPFDDRQVNGSWVAARHLDKLDNVRALEIPVIWGKPAELLTPLCKQDCPAIIISFGEGRDEWFDIEIKARNQRDHREDNLGRFADSPIDPNGTDLLESSFDTHELQRQLGNQGWNIRVSGNAGQYLCEELLYTLESLKAKHQSLQSVVFIHMPPFGSNTFRNGEPVECNDKLITNFAADVLAVVESLTVKELPELAPDLTPALTKYP